MRTDKQSKALVLHLNEAMDCLRATLPLFSRSDEPELHELIYHAGMTIRAALNKVDAKENPIHPDLPST